MSDPALSYSHCQWSRRGAQDRVLSLHFRFFVSFLIVVYGSRQSTVPSIVRSTFTASPTVVTLPTTIERFPLTSFNVQRRVFAEM